MRTVRGGGSYTLEKRGFSEVTIKLPCKRGQLCEKIRERACCVSGTEGEWYDRVGGRGGMLGGGQAEEGRAWGGTAGEGLNHIGLCKPD